MYTEGLTVRILSPFFNLPSARLPGFTLLTKMPGSPGIAGLVIPPSSAMPSLDPEGKTHRYVSVIIAWAVMMDNGPCSFISLYMYVC